MLLFLFIYSQVVVSEKSTISKLIYKYKLFEVKNGDNLIDKKMLLFIVNLQWVICLVSHFIDSQ